MTNRDVIIALVSSVIAGLAVWLIQQSYTNRKEHLREQASKTIKSLNENRKVTDDIFWTLAPGRSIALMKEMLGVPDIFRRTDSPIFSYPPLDSEEGSDDEDPKTVNTHSYIYMFENAHVKITSRENESIDSITVTGADKSLSADSLLLPEGAGSTKFGEFKVWSGLIKDTFHHKYVRTMRDSFFALEVSTGPPIHQHITFFGYSASSTKYEDSNDPRVLIGSAIEGVCISANLQDVYYIYEYEYR